jgi:hypothetical protein
VRVRRAEERRRRLAAQGRSEAEIASEASPVLLNTCYAYADTRETVKRRWPHLYRGPKDTAGTAPD